MTTMFATRMSRLSSSPIRDILRVIDQPGMISFAGGLPSAASFPEFAGSIDRRFLQYGPSEGEIELREWVSQDLAARGLNASPEQILILSGSQQGIDLVAKLLIDTGTRVAVESPSYLAALQVFSLFGADYLPFDCATLANAFDLSPPRLLYTIPTFQNPSTRVYTRVERLAIAERCDEMKTVLFEDDPYRELVYEECDRTPVCSFVKNAPWIYQSSFSKTLAPGIRLGYLACSKELYPMLLRLKQAADLHSNRVSQSFVLDRLKAPTAAERLEQLRANYRQKCECFNELLKVHFHDLAVWRQPKGGMFFWLTLRGEPVDTRSLLNRALDRGVAFMPGEPFYCDGRQYSNAIRLNFSHAEPFEMDRGLRILSQILRH